MADDLHPLLDRLEALLGSRDSEPEPLDGGITNRNYRVRMGGDDYVVRICGKDTDVLGIERDAECQATIAAAGLGIGPELAAYLPEQGCLVMRWIEGSRVEARELRGALLEEVAALLRAVHAGPALPARFDSFRIVEAYRDEVLARGGRLPDVYPRAAAAAARIERALHGPDHAPVPCHNDLLTANFLHDSDRLRLVDWEYAGMGDRFFDLGNLAVNNGLQAAEEARLLEAYFGVAPSRGRTAALALMRVMSDFREAMWGAVQEVVSELEVDYGAYRDQHFERLIGAVGAPHFERSLSDAATA